ncbi:ankyrin repeat domain-containing protein [Variovorax paradoxus]|nr:ankyrin repeat domain-containing protein [Variovorax paradoxus]MBT2300226.1 ankyrin repeat domain-containing protein [Variovorax paradoxus]
MRNYIRKFIYLSVFAASFSVYAGSFEDFFRAVRSDNAGSVKELLNRGFDPNTRDEHGQTGLLIALREPSPKVIQVLLDSPQTNVELRNAKDESPLMMAALKGQQDLVTQLIARDADVNKPGWAPLHYAATNGHVAVMKQLLDNHAFIDAQSPNGTTPLMMAAMYGSASAVQLLLDEGADTQMKNEQGLTAIDFAQRANRSDAVRVLSTAVRAKRSSDGKW